MDGIHDLGGKQGFGPVDVHENEDPFHAPWEARLYGIVRGLTRAKDWNIDWFRHCRELADPVEYLTRGYYDQWLMAYGAMMVNSGMATVKEVATGHSTTAAAGFPSPMPPGAIMGSLKTVTSFQRKASTEPRFAVGQKVRTVANGHSGHTRLPAYARGRTGVIETYHGFHVFPDANAHGTERAEPLYTVVFDHAELWPESTLAKGFVALDLWESYFEPG